MRTVKEKLESPRLILRAWQESDLEDFYAYASVPGVGEMAGWPHHTSIEGSKQILDMFMNSDEFAITDKQTGKLYGSLGIRQATVFPEEMKDKKGIELGYVVAKDSWGKGIATEAVREVIRYAFFELSMDYVTIAYFKRNPASKRVSEKCGFKKFCDYTYKTFMDTFEDSDYTILKKEEYFTGEYYQIYDSNMNPVDMKIMRPAYVPEGFYFGIVDVITYNLKNHSFLVTKRARNKPYLPGLLEITAGAMQYGENPLDSAKRELFEETGVSAKEIYAIDRIRHIHAISHMYLAIVTVEADSIVLQEGETDEYFWLSKEEFQKLWDTNLVTEVQKDRLKRILPSIFHKIKEVTGE